MRVNKKRLFYHNTCEFYFFTDGNKKAGANKTPALSIAAEMAVAPKWGAETVAN